MKVSKKRFQEMADRAFAEIPAYFRGKLGNISIEVKTVPGKEAGNDKDLLGLHIEGNELFPARIILYSNNILSMAQSEGELMREIRLTLRHEIAHQFGFSEEDIERRWPEGA